MPLLFWCHIELLMLHFFPHALRCSAILFSHPADFTPVCTTEIGRLALKYDELAAMDCLVATLSVDPVRSHNDWLNDVVAHCENEIQVRCCCCCCLCLICLEMKENAFAHLLSLLFIIGQVPHYW